MFREKCKVLSNEKIAPGHFILKFASPKISSAAQPGQFVQIMASDSYEPLLPRPFSFLDADKKTFSILYHVVGKGTEILSQARAGNELWITGPLGNGFTVSSRASKASAAISHRTGKIASSPAAPRNDVILVGGGVGIPPLFHLAKELIKNGFPKKNIHVFLGARNKSLLMCEADFKKLGVTLHLSTDDGTKGAKGYVTVLLDQFLKSNRVTTSVHTCGPTPMLRAVSVLAGKYKVPCEVSVEVPMACGFGACLGCAITVEKNGEKRHAIACCEGPVFQGSEIVWA